MQVSGFFCNSFQYFGRHCFAIPGRLEFYAHFTPHHHILMSLEGIAIHENDEIDIVLCVELFI